MTLSRSSTQNPARSQFKEEVLPKHPTNKKPYPHSPPGITTSGDGDIIQLTYDALDIEKATKEVQSKWAGATSIFLGSTREDWTGKDAASTQGSNDDANRHLKVTRLEYESYTPLALKTLRAIARKARTTPSAAWPPPTLDGREIERLDAEIESELSASELHKGSGKDGKTSGGTTLSKRNSRRFNDKDIKKVLSSHEPTSPPSSPDAVLHIHISHRLGPVPVGTPSILLAVSTPHRRRAFQISEWILEETKRCVPIWKREVREPIGSSSGKGSHHESDRRKSVEDKSNSSIHAAANGNGHSEWVGLYDSPVQTAAAANGNAADVSNAVVNDTLGGKLSRLDTRGEEEIFQDALAPTTSRI